MGNVLVIAASVATGYMLRDVGTQPVTDTCVDLLVAATQTWHYVKNVFTFYTSGNHRERSTGGTVSVQYKSDTGVFYMYYVWNPLHNKEDDHLLYVRHSDVITSIWVDPINKELHPLLKPGMGTHAHCKVVLKQQQPGIENGASEEVVKRIVDVYEAIANAPFQGYEFPTPHEVVRGLHFSETVVDMIESVSVEYPLLFTTVYDWSSSESQP